MRYYLLICLFFASTISGCRSLTDSQSITKINIIDRNGLSETISGKDRLDSYQNTDFLAPQPYQKVMRIYGKEKNGDVHSCITSYHPNGQIKQYLEAVNNRAYGTYREWYANGQLKIEALVIGGIADINTHAEESWLFDKVNKAWDEEGNLSAEIRYNKGELEGESIYYHPNGKIWKITPFLKNKCHGCQKIYLDNGTLLQTAEYQQGLKEGVSIRFWDGSKMAYHEKYEKGKLLEGVYYDPQANQVSAISGGNGFRALFGKQQLQELQEYRNGSQEGIVKVFDDQGNLSQTYSIQNGEKEGEEIYYFPFEKTPRLLITWHEGMMQGVIKTWYPNGNLESQKEMSCNQKNGLSTAWYQNGALMLVEEYDCNNIVKGEYYRMGEQTPLSRIEKGKGIATLFLPDGTFSRKIPYQDGKPFEAAMTS